MKKLQISLFLTALTFTLSCAETLQTIPSTYNANQKSECIVIGQMVFPDSEFIMAGNQLAHTDGGSFTIKSVETNKEYTIKPEKDNSYFFYVVVPYGKFNITEITWGNFTGAPEAVVEINKENKICYIGTIKITKAKTTTSQNVGSWLLGNITGGRRIPINYSIEDNYELVSKSFRKKYPDINDEIAKSLITFVR